MSALFADGIVLPVVVLLVLGWAVPFGLAKVMPEGVAALLALAVVAFVILLVLAGTFFAGVYVGRGAPLGAFSLPQAVAHFGRLGLLSGIIWLPIMVLSVANLPRHWKTEVW